MDGGALQAVLDWAPAPVLGALLWLWRHYTARQAAQEKELVEVRHELASLRQYTEREIESVRKGLDYHREAAQDLTRKVDQLIAEIQRNRETLARIEAIIDGGLLASVAATAAAKAPKTAPEAR